MSMNLLREVTATARQTVNRALSVIDAMRPKILIKKPLSELMPMQGEAIISGELGGVVERLMSRIEEIRSVARSSVAPSPAPAVSGEAEKEVHGLQIVKDKKKEGFIY